MKQWIILSGISAAVFLVAVLAGEPSGGGAGGANAAAVGLTPRAGRLPWPEPDAAKVRALKDEMRGELTDDFTILNVGPWVIATDLSRDEAASFAQSTIEKYAAAIQRQLFTATARADPVKVLLFKDRPSYLKWNAKLYNEVPTTPYGYYSRARNALVMNIGTGGGTLLHEMTHAMAEPDFPEIPAWLNEGLGSLFEASAMDRAGKVGGVANWRLRGLREDLARKSAVHFKDLLALDNAEFYGARSGSNYAAARYLMQWLQEQGKLEAFYWRVRDKKDADGPAALRAVFDGKLTIDEIEAKCYAWVKTLVLE